MSSSTCITAHPNLQRISLTSRHLRPSSLAHPSRRRPFTIRSNYVHSPFRTPKNTDPIRTQAPAQFPTIPTCPPSDCACASMPSGLKIDHERALTGTMPPYAQHVVIRTGRNDWGSRIEDEEEGAEGTGMNFAASLKRLVGRGGRFFNPERPILISNSSLPAFDDPGSTSVNLYPNNLLIRGIGHTPEYHKAFVSNYLVSNYIQARNKQEKKAIQKSKEYLNATRFPSLDEDFVARKLRLEYTKNTTPTILICGHNSRDPRCGILGPMLKAEFISYIYGRSQLLAENEISTGSDYKGLKFVRPIRRSSIALVSHIGGHAFAGNVIIYIPKTFTLQNGMVSPLAGTGIWYGRVEPRHVQGIVEETIKKGCVITELLRGVHAPA